MFKKRWLIAEQIYFLSNTGKLLEKGYDLGSAIELLKLQQKDVRKRQYDICLNHLKVGGSLYEILSIFHFSKDVLGYLFFSEKHGDLAFALTEGGKMLEKKYSFQKKLTQLLKYPIALSMFVLLLFVFIQNFLLPQFIQMYISMEAKQSPFMTLMITLPQYYLEITIFISSFFFLFILTYLLYFRKKSEKRKMLYVLRIPILGKIMRLKNTQYFSVQLSCLLKGGLSVLEVLSVFEEQRHLPFFKEEARQLKTMLTEGESLDNIINDSPFYEKDLSSVVTHGQANGMLAAALSDYSELLVDRIEIRVNEITACIQPIVFLVLSSFVILVYLSMMLPLVQMMENL